MTDKEEIPDVNWLSDQDTKSSEEKKKSMKQLYVKYLSARDDIVKARHFSPPEDVKDYVFQSFDGKDVKLSELFGDKDELILIINMGTKCPYCTMWGDGFNGYRKHLEDAAAFCVMSNDPPEVQKKFAESRGWEFNMVSGHKNSFTSDLNNENATVWAYETKVKPGVNTFHIDKKTGKIQRIARDSFGGNDHFQPVFRLLELTKGNLSKDWEPKHEYPDIVGDKRKREEEECDETEPCCKKSKVE